MKIYNAIFPYPVLSPNSDDVSFNICQFTPNITQDSQSKDFNIAFTLDIDDTYILNLIKTGYAKYMMEISCAGTHLLKRVSGSSNILCTTLKSGEVKDNVEITLTITATKQIKEYQNPNAHPAFGNNKFTIEPGEILAFFATEILKTDIRYSQLGSASSFIEIRPLNDDSKYMKIDIDSPIIGICLPKVMYESYKEISRNTDFLETIHASIVCNALQYALMRFEDYKERELTWVKTIQYYLDNLDILKNMQPIVPETDDDEESILSDPEVCMEVAQIILDNPIERLLKNLCEKQTQKSELINDEV